MITNVSDNNKKMFLLKYVMNLKTNLFTHENWQEKLDM